MVESTKNNNSVIFRSLFEGNIANLGGSITILSDRASIIGNSFLNNRALSGGALFINGTSFIIYLLNMQYLLYIGNIALKENLFINNTAKVGGAISYVRSRPKINFCNFSNNSAVYGENIASYPIKIKLHELKFGVGQNFPSVRPSSDTPLISKLTLGLYDIDSQLVCLNYSDMYFF